MVLLDLEHKAVFFPLSLLSFATLPITPTGDSLFPEIYNEYNDYLTGGESTMCSPVN